MADRVKTILSGEVLHAGGVTVTASSTLDATWLPSKVLDGLLGGQLSGDGWVSQNPAVLPEWLQFDLGVAKYMDEWWIAMAGWDTNGPRDFKIQHSADGVAWTDLLTVADAFGAAAPADGVRYYRATFARTSARYWRLYISLRYGATYIRVGEVHGFDSTVMGADLYAAATFTYYGAASSAKANGNDGRYQDNAYCPFFANTTCGLFDVDLGTAKFVGGWDWIAYRSNAYWPEYIYLFGKDNAGDDWSLLEKVTLPAKTDNRQQWTPLPLSRIYKRRYFRWVIPIGTGGDAGVLPLHEWDWRETLAPAAPAAPSALVVTGDADDNAALQLRWSHAGASDDNLAADIDFEIQRAKDGGAYATIATVTSKYYVDSGLAAGSYTYKVRAVNRFHAEASAYTAASAAEVVPIAAAAAGGGPALQRGLAG